MCYMFADDGFKPKTSQNKQLVGGVIGRKPGRGRGSGRGSGSGSGSGSRPAVAVETNSPYIADPKVAAHAIASAIINGDEKARDEFKEWGYGQSIIIDALMLASERLGENFMTVNTTQHAGGDGRNALETVMQAWVNPLLDGFLQPGQPAHFLAGGTIPPVTSADKAIGDHIGLFPHAYLRRATYYVRPNASRPLPAGGYARAVDLKVARTTVDDFILKWPIRWVDRTITRDYPGEGMAALGPTWVNTSEHQFVWVRDDNAISRPV